MRIEIECLPYHPASFLLTLSAAITLPLLFDLHILFCFSTNLPILWPFDLCPLTCFCVAVHGPEVSSESLFCPAELDSLFSYFDASGQRSSKYRTTPGISWASSSSTTLPLPLHLILTSLAFFFKCYCGCGVPYLGFSAHKLVKCLWKACFACCGK